MAAFGHPLVGDSTYGFNGDAAKNGGLTDAELESLAPNPARADASLQEAAAWYTPDDFEAMVDMGLNTVQVSVPTSAFTEG